MSKPTKGKTKKNETIESVADESVMDTDETGMAVPEETVEADGGTATPTEEAAPADAAQLRAEIEETRTELGETIDAIQEKLDPQHIKEQVVEKIHDATVGQAQHLKETASEKLAPVMEAASEKAALVGEKLAPATEKLDEVRHQVEEAIQPTLESLEPVAQIARQKGDEFVRLVRRYPLPAAAIAVAALVGGWFLFPHDDD